MRVPVNPQTSVPSGTLGYERAADVSSGLAAIGKVVNDYAEYAADEQKKRELFDVQRLLVDETNNIQTDFEDRQRTAKEPWSPTFVPQINTAYTTRHADMVKALREKGYSDDAVNEFATRLGAIRGQYIAKAIDFREKSNFTKVVSDSDDLATNLSQYASNNPDGVQSALNEMELALSHSTLSKPEQIAIFDKEKKTILQGAREGYAIQHPEAVLGLYGFPNELKNKIEPSTGQIVNLGQAQQTVAFQFQRAGLNPNVVAGFLGNFVVEDGYTGKTGDGGKAKGIAQWHDDRLANYEKATGKPFNPTDHESQAKFVLWELQNPKAAGMTVAQRDAILKAKTPEQAAELIDKYYERSNGKARQKRVDAALAFVSAHADQTTAELKPIPPGWKGNQEDAIQELGMTADQAAEFLRTGKDTRTAPSATTFLASDPEAVQQAGISFDENGRTGIPAIDLSSGPERLQMLTLARTIMNERRASQDAADREAHEQWLNNFLNGVQDGKLGQSDINAAYESGQLSDFDERRKVQQVYDELHQKNDDLARFQVMLSSGQKFNPYDKDAQKAADAGYNEALKYTENGQHADPFVLALRTWQRTGILPTQGGVMIRGGLVSTDPKQVRAAANVAGNMLRENPNAFVGTEGQNDIEHAAVNFNHYVYDLGMSPDMAANRIAQENDPKFKQRIKLTEPEQTDAFRQLRQNGVRAQNAFKGGSFANLDAQNEANQTYHELIVENLTKGLDYSSAFAQADAQMKKLYSLNKNGHIMKYAPEAIYPQVNGSWNYIYDDAGQTVKQETGHNPTAVQLIPIPGVTDQDFREGHPARYKLIYSYDVNGQRIIDTVPGQFAADVSTAISKASSKRQDAFAERRRNAIISQKAVDRALGQAPTRRPIVLGGPQ